MYCDVHGPYYQWLESWGELSVTTDKSLVEDNVLRPSVVLNIGKKYHEVANRAVLPSRVI